MNRQSLWSIAAMMMASMMFVGCFEDDNPIPVTATGDDASDLAAYTAKEQSVNYYGNTTKTLSLRYYEDMPDVAYVSVDDFQQLLVEGTRVSVQKTGTSQYQLTGNGGATAAVNTADETIAFDNFKAFTDLSGRFTTGTPKHVNMIPCVRETKSNIQPSAGAYTIQFKKYGIDLRADGSHVYMPLNTLADIYLDGDFQRLYFNGNKAVVFDPADKGISTIDPDFVREGYTLDTRTQGMADYCYGEMCFYIDHFYGHPGRSTLDAAIISEGLDKALQDDYPNVRKLLLSTDMAEYSLGMDYLGSLLEDGGHTVIGYHVTAMANGYSNIAIPIAQLRDKWPNEFEIEGRVMIDMILKAQYKLLVAQKRLTLLNIDDKTTYAKLGNTAYCIYNSFGACDMTAWKACYNGGTIPQVNVDFPGDPIVVYHAMKRASEDPEVENFVLDLSLNGGGDTSFLVLISAMMKGEAYMKLENSPSGQSCTYNYDVDTHFNSTFKLGGDELFPDLNKAVLTSRYSFSCSNLLPMMLKKHGVLVIGERSGGGACCVTTVCTPQGLTCKFSSAFHRLASLTGEDVDKGIEPHISLPVTEVVSGNNSMPDFSSFYTPEVGQKIKQWYAKP